MLKLLAVIFGLVMIAVGVLGFLPQFTPEGKLLGYFAVNFWHNIIHLATGIIALLCGLYSSFAAKTFFIIFGIVYAAVAIIGFWEGEGMLLGMVSLNQADNYLHLVIALISLYFGLFLRRR